jgi:tRNA threonylcarbamoyladenosine biosynthesis protein TsaE
LIDVMKGVAGHTHIVKSSLWSDEAQTAAFAAAWAKAVRATPELGDVFVALRGDLGAGKTTLVRHLLGALGVQGRIKSPTYAVVEPYSVTLADGHDATALNIWHFDFYRFSDPREWEDAGFRDLFASPGLKLAEWPDNAASHLPRADLCIALELLADDSRHVTLTAQTQRGLALLKACMADEAGAA